MTGLPVQQNHYALMDTVTCTNLQCRAIIHVLPGLSMVICPQCGQWVETDDAVQAPEMPRQSQPQAFPDYDLPPSYSDAPSSFPSASESPAPSGPSGYFPPASPPGPFGGYGAPPSQDMSAGLLSDPLPEQREEELRPLATGKLILPDGRALPLELGRHTIGRQRSDILINDPSVSRQHCVIEVSPDPRAPGTFQYLIWDVGHDTGTASTNGVFLSHRSLRLQNHECIPLADGTVITLGTVRLLFQIERNHT